MKKNTLKIIILIHMFLLSNIINIGHTEDLRYFVSENKYLTVGNSANEIYYEPVVEYVEPIEYAYVEPVVIYDDAYQVLALVNNVRRENGLNELVMDYTLIEIAKVRTEEATRNWAHTRPDGSSYSTLFSQYNVYGIVGENLAYGQSTPEEVFNAWMNSPSHKDNILYSGFNRIGIAIYNYNGTLYWAQEFAD